MTAIEIIDLDHHMAHNDVSAQVEFRVWDCTSFPPE